MAEIYEALYRKWRSKTFEDVVAQGHITGTLKRQVALGRTAHAYLFTGSRGTGKTTCARILAKAVNCLSPKDGSPCLECRICKDAENFRLGDIVEIDAASNNGINDIRDLRDGAAFTPERCAYRVYIIDEVHMLSTQAFNGLLKIMEEPPSYVKFILATTEIHKVPATILSRCQRYDFHRIRAEDISEHLQVIARGEGILLAPEAALLMATIADGGMRDAISLLDQCAAFSEEITQEVVSAAAGIAGREPTFKLLEALWSQDPAGALRIIGELHSLSKDVNRLCEELIWQTRNLMLIKSAPQQRELLACTDSEFQRLHTLADKASLSQILEHLTLLQDCYQRMGKALNPRVELEVGVIRLCRLTAPATAPGVDNSLIYDKIKRLELALASRPIPCEVPDKVPDKVSAEAHSEKAVERAKSPEMPAVEPQEDSPMPPPQAPLYEPPITQSASLPTASPSTANIPASASPQTAQTASLPTASSSTAIKQPAPEDFKPCALWTEVLEAFDKVNPAVSSTLAGSKAMTAGNVMLLTVPNNLFASLFKQKENAASLSQVIEQVLGQRYVVRAKCDLNMASAETAAPLQPLVDKARRLGIPVEEQ